MPLSQRSHVAAVATIAARRRRCSPRCVAQRHLQQLSTVECGRYAHLDRCHRRHVRGGPPPAGGWPRALREPCPVRARSQQVVSGEEGWTVSISSVVCVLSHPSRTPRPTNHPCHRGPGDLLRHHACTMDGPRHPPRCCCQYHVHCRHVHCRPLPHLRPPCPLPPFPPPLPRPPPLLPLPLPRPPLLLLLLPTLRSSSCNAPTCMLLAPRHVECKQRPPLRRVGPRLGKPLAVHQRHITAMLAAARRALPLGANGRPSCHDACARH